MTVSWTSVTGVAAALGLAVALVSTPVRAEEAPAQAPAQAPEQAPAQAPALTASEIEKRDLEKEQAALKGAATKEERLKKDMDQLSKEGVKTDFAEASGKNDGGSVAPVKRRKK